MKDINRNSIILVIAIILFGVIVLLSCKLSAKGAGSDEASSLTFSAIVEPIETKSYEAISYEVSSSSDSLSTTEDEEFLVVTDNFIESHEFNQVGYSKAKLNIRTSPDKSSEIWDTYYYNERIQYYPFNDNWLEVDWNGELGYVSASYVSDDPMKYRSKSVSNDSRKSFEDYKRLSSSSRQGKLQKHAKTSPSGLRKVQNRYCVAVGSYFSHIIGQYIDVVLANGVIIPCIIGDAKADGDTSDDHSVGMDGGCVEFIVDIGELPSHVRSSGDCSGCKSDWSSPVVEIRLYDYIMNP